MKIIQNTWAAPIKNWQDIDVRTAELWLKEGQSLFDDFRHRHDVLTARAEKLIALCTIILTALFTVITYLISAKASMPSELVSFGVVFTISYIVVIGICIKVIYFRSFLTIRGNMPSSLMKQSYIKSTPSDDVQYLELLLRQSESLQSKIDHDLKVYSKTSSTIDWAIRGFIVVSLLATSFCFLQVISFLFL